MRPNTSPGSEPGSVRRGGGEFEIRLKGEIGERSLALFEGFDHAVEPITTLMRGTVADEHELAAICRRIRDAGFELISLRRISSGQGRHP